MFYSSEIERIEISGAGLREIRLVESIKKEYTELIIKQTFE